ncbi:MAG: restriction endonuclease [Candidatus Hodarchaeota archaeon]
MKISVYNKEYLKERFEELEKMENPQARGREFEDFLVHLFRASGFLCQKDIRSESGEQIDLILRWGQFLALVEAKWQISALSITDLQAFMWRRKNPQKSG